MTIVQRVQQLEYDLANSAGLSDAEGYAQIDRLNELAWLLRETDAERAAALSEAAARLAEAAADDAVLSQAGIAYSLRTQGYLNMRSGDYPQGLVQLLKAQAIFETLSAASALGVDDGLIDVFDGIASIHIQMGNLPEGLDYTYRMFTLARPINDTQRICNANNNLAVIYSEQGDPARSREIIEQNLALAIEIADLRIETMSNINLGSLLVETGNYQAALAYLQRGLQLSQQAGFVQFEIYAFDFMGRLELKLGNGEQAIAYLEQALARAQQLGSKTNMTLHLWTLGKAYHTLGQPERALAYLQQSVALAQAIDEKLVSNQAYLALSEVYEQQGDAVQALAAFKQYHVLKEHIAGEKADQRLKVLHVVYETKAAKQQAARLEQQVEQRTAELQKAVSLLRSQIAERERAEEAVSQMVATLEQRVAARTAEVAAFFDLTLLANQALKSSDVFAQVLPRIIEVTRSQAISIHLLDDDRTSLALAGQLNLSSHLQPAVQIAQLPPGFQRWIKRPSDPLLTTALSELKTLPPAFHIAGLQTYLGAQIRVGTRIEGVLSCYRSSDHGFGLDEVALVMALAEQIGMMIASQRSRQKALALAVIEERQRLARDLHDSVTQSLYSLALFARSGREATEDGDGDRLERSLGELERTTLHALQNMRLLLYELRPTDLEYEGLVRAIHIRLDMVERSAGLKCVAKLAELPSLTPRFEAELYHIIAESLNNVVKHAAATQVTLELTQADRQVLARITDDGQGFEPQQSRGGMGLANIRARVAKLNGQVIITSMPGSGTQIEVIVPYPVEDMI